MSEAGFDDLEFARQQLHLVVEETSGTEMTPQDRVQLGLLAAQVALGDRLSALLGDDAVAETDPTEHRSTDTRLAVVDELALAAGKASKDVQWTPALSERILRSSTSSGYRLVQALVAEGGSASVARLVELTGDPLLRSATQSLNMAARREGIAHTLPERRLIQAYRYPNPLTSKVAGYALPVESIPSFTTAVELVGELHRRLNE
ncbi:hypothetical protein [Nocardia flavorosea]|uniref:hypothetical protein n=1 Tax=Nocardia flavorosea TaxID=53429 RepID=UPI002458DCC1|nr:hypothetical protein [Nocardia flavorosea]